MAGKTSTLTVGSFYAVDRRDRVDDVGARGRFVSTPAFVLGALSSIFCGSVQRLLCHDRLLSTLLV